MEFNATFLVTAISFIVFTFVMNKIFYEPLTKVINERENFINGTISDAKNSEQQAEILLKNKEDKIKQTSAKTAQIITDATNKAEADAEELTNEAKRQALLKLEVAEHEIKEEAVKVQSDLKTKVKSLAELIASKILQEEMHIDEVNNDLIDRILV